MQKAPARESRGFFVVGVKRPLDALLFASHVVHLLPSRRYPVGGERANFTFELEADFTQVFNWNVRQTFVYVTAEYETELGDSLTAKNSVVVWDRIIRPDGRNFPYWQHCPNDECDDEPCKEDEMEHCKHMVRENDLYRLPNLL